jgi:hypothetical protein
MAFEDFNPSVDYYAGTYVWEGKDLFQFVDDHPAGKWDFSHVQIVSRKELINMLGKVWDGVQDLYDALANLDNNESKRYGVSGIGQSTAALTRIYDAVGMTANVGTDDSTVSVVNDFDAAAPFMHRKCVGNWTLGDDGYPKFNVQAYLGDPAYAEDGSKGDYVAVELPLSYYMLQGTQLVISSMKYPGMRAFDIFCRDHDQSKALEKVYVPAYALALDGDGHAVSLPGLDNEQGDYKTLFENARKYNNNDVKGFGMMMPAALEFYYWALMVVEFADQNVQTTMAGAAALRSANSTSGTFLTDTDHFLCAYSTPSANGMTSKFIVGQRVAITKSTSHDNKDYKATHKILSITRCDEDGTENVSGSYMLIEVEDLDRDYVTYNTTDTFYIASRPWQTGACNSVVTPSGSPVNNTDGQHPMRYRYRENVYGNQYHTSVDLFAKMEGTYQSGSEYLDWYYLPDPSDVETPKNPAASDLADDPYVKLTMQNPAGFASGYIKERQYDTEYPDLWTGLVNSGGSATTYYCDYASLVISTVVRSARFGGYWAHGCYAGFYLYAYITPSSASALYCADLCFAQ